MAPLPDDNFFSILSTLEPGSVVQIPTGPEIFTFSNQRAPNSPPSTPGSVSSNRARQPRITPHIQNKRHGIIGPLLSPPENPRLVDNQNSQHTRTHGDVPSDSEEESNGESGNESDDEEDDNNDSDDSSDDESEAEENIMELTEAPMAPIFILVPELPDAPQRAGTISIASSVISIIDILIEEITEDDTGYDSDTSVLFPCHCEDFQTDAEKAQEAAEESEESFDWSSSESEESLVGNMGSLLLRHQEREFEEAQRQKYLRKKQRWIKGGNHKRNIGESLGSESDTEDIVPLDDADVVGSSARRLRRRTDTMELRPRTSLLFEDPPREIEELQFLQGDGGVIESDDELVPAWMYPGMDVDSDSDEEEEDEDESIPVIYLPPTRSRR